MSDSTSKYRLEFTLKQHTPIIHFQADQKGATLRASELKPKLDRFLIDKLKMLENGKPKKEYRSWFIGGGKEHLALDYKVRIEQSKNIKYYLPLPISLNSKRYPNKEKETKSYLKNKKYINFDFDFLYPTLYFANADKIKFKPDGNINPNLIKPNEIIYALQANENIKLFVTSLHADLLSAVEENIASFFVKENFGTRQNKGFFQVTTHSLFIYIIITLQQHLFIGDFTLMLNNFK